MKIVEAKLPGVYFIEADMFRDARGYFFELWNEARYTNSAIATHFVQDNVSFSTKGTMRGLHLQNPNAQAKLVYVLQGEVFDVAVDVRHGSPTFCQWVGRFLSAENGRQLYVPESFAHGFCVLSETALFGYKCAEYYHPESELSIAWDDPDIGISWPLDAPVLSDKDRKAPRISDFPRDVLPQFEDRAN